MKIKLKTFEQAIADAKFTAFGASDSTICGLTADSMPWGEFVDAEFLCDSDDGMIFKANYCYVPFVCFDTDDESFDFISFDYIYSYESALYHGKTLSDDNVGRTRIRIILWDDAIWRLKEVNGKLYYYNKLYDIK